MRSRGLFALLGLAPLAGCTPAADTAPIPPAAIAPVPPGGAGPGDDGLKPTHDAALPLIAPATALDAMLAAFNAAKARGFGDREALVDALGVLREAPLVQSRGRGAARVNAKTARRLQRAIDAVRAEAFFEPVA